MGIEYLLPISGKWKVQQEKYKLISLHKSKALVNIADDCKNASKKTIKAMDFQRKTMINHLGGKVENH